MDGRTSRCRPCIAADVRARSTPEQRRVYDQRRKAKRNERLRRKRINDRAWAEKVDAIRERRRQLARYEITYDDLYARDDAICHICRTYVEKHDGEQDHVIPLVHGGGNAPENVKLAHRSCNRQKSDRLDWRDKGIMPLAPR